MNIMKNKKFKQKRKLWFRCFKVPLHIRYKKCEFIYLGEKIKQNGLVISNHEGTDAPLSLELYADFPVRFWGTAEMNSGLIKMYKYQTKVYYHEKKHWNLFLARMFCLIASPLTNIFYKGLNLISTYRDSRFRGTIKESIDAIKSGDNVVVFPEKSPNGYVAELEGFYAGFLVLAKSLEKEGFDIPIYVCYFKKKEKQYIFDKPIKFSELKVICQTREEMTKYLLDRCNALGKMEFETAKQKKKRLKQNNLNSKS